MNEYIAITKNTLIENTKIEFDLFLRSDIRGRSQYILFCRGNEQFSQQRKGELLNRNIQRLYISTKDTDKYLRYQEKNLKQIIEDSSKDSLEKSGVLYQVAENITKEILDDPKSGQNIERASEWVSNTVQHIVQDENTFYSLFTVTSQNYQLYTHSINVSVIGLLFGKYLSLKPHELDCLGTGLLLHDIGMATISPDVINNSNKLTREELDVIRRHPKAGLELLEQRGNIDGLSLKVVIQHHENHDGTGYPYGIGEGDIHLFGSISRIVDAYDAMTSNKGYADAMTPFAALAEMKSKKENFFNKELLKEFICFLGPKDSHNKSKLYNPSSLAE
ncbi:hypothetical protein SCALIN_C14_0098 [Candidatus Scalindua japonica]|uniref:HD-GYP domain-containing protein n=1 Tax=Candidatus Scalindua japonica TaxID=1284222 RepID=A0A286TY68_9BACT|nr:HD domain-containing phosphohydrolase [Candidatus Scalindua japonica]GAX60832.1 hypothetical protein SCALIN_C14_0098 [Candidatus Scalindua japonica]